MRSACQLFHTLMQLWTVTSCCVTVNSVSRRLRTMSSRCVPFNVLL